MEYYDLILGSIPASIATATGVLSLLGLGVTVSITIGAVVASLFILHAMFVRAPSATSAPDTTRSAPAYQSAD